MDPIDDVDIHKWLLEVVQINPGYGVERLLSRINDRFDERGAEWNRRSLTNWLRRASASGKRDYWALLEDEKWLGGSFQDPMDADGDGNITEEEVIKYVRIHDPDYNEDDYHGYGALRSNKHKIAYLLAEKFDLRTDLSDYYSKYKEEKKGGGTVTKRYWSDLCKKLRLGQYNSGSLKKADLVKLIFEECNVSTEFDEERHIGSGSTVKVAAFVDLCEHFGVDLPASLVSGAEDDEEDSRIDIGGTINPILVSEAEPIGDIVDQFVAKRIFVPEFQRQFTWNVKKQRALIDSILIGIPLPSILLIKEVHGDWWLVDGQQRITTLRRFIQPEDSRDTFHLGDLVGENGRYSNLNFMDLSDTVQDRIRGSTIPVTRITGLENHKRAIYLLYMRYNTGGETLNAAQIRHAIFHENFSHRALFKLAGENQQPDEQSKQTKEVRKLLRIGKSSQPTKYKIYNRISRFYGYCYSEPGGSTTNTVYEFFETREDGTIEEATEMSSRFLETARLCDQIFGEKIRFMKLKEDGEKGTFGDIPYTMQMVSARMLLDDHPDQVEKIKKIREKVVEKWKKYYLNEIFDVRQNSSNIWRWQKEWCSILGGIVKGLDESEYELMLGECSSLFESGGNVGKFLEQLGAKDYYDELFEECRKRGWIT